MAPNLYSIALVGILCILESCAIYYICKRINKTITFYAMIGVIFINLIIMYFIAR